MTRVLSWSLSFMSVAVGIFALAATYESHVLSAKASDTLAGINKTVETVNTTVSSLNKTLVAINQPKYGVIAELDDNLKNSRVALDNLNQVAIKERFFLEKTQPEEVAKLNKVLDSTNALIQSSTQNEATLTASATGAVDTLNIAVKALVPVEQHLDTTVAALGEIVNDPNVKETEKNVQVGTAALAETAKEGQEWLHGILHPSWPSRIKSWTIDALTVLK